MRNLQLLILAIGAFFALLTGSARIYGDDIRWRASYAAAYQEATETGRPLFMEFGSADCIWCKRLEETTLRTPEVVKLINDRFVPVKIDAHVDTDLANTVGVQLLPTLFVLAPDRTILNRHEGYAEAPKILQFLEQGLRKNPPPVAMK